MPDRIEIGEDGNVLAYERGETVEQWRERTRTEVGALSDDGLERDEIARELSIERDTVDAILDNWSADRDGGQPGYLREVSAYVNARMAWTRAGKPEGADEYFAAYDAMNAALDKRAEYDGESIIRFAEPRRPS